MQRPQERAGGSQEPVAEAGSQAQEEERQEEMAAGRSAAPGGPGFALPQIQMLLPASEQRTAGLHLTTSLCLWERNRLEGTGQKGLYAVCIIFLPDICHGNKVDKYNEL